MPPLTPRQAEIAQLLAGGMSYKGVALELGLSVNTVKIHVARAADRLPGDVSPKLKLVLFVLNLREEPKRQAC